MLVRDKHPSLLDPFVNCAKNYVSWMHTKILDAGRKIYYKLWVGRWIHNISYDKLTINVRVDVS